MGLRYEDVTEEVLDMLKEVRAEYFPELKNAKIKMLFDLKKRTSGGRLTLGRIMKTNDLLRLLTIDRVDPIEGYDYIITLDRTCWDVIERDDKVRIIRHELRHAYFDIDSDENPYKLVDHSVSDFYEELDLNKDDPRWHERVGALTEGIYEQRKDELTESRNKKKKREF